MGPNLDSNQPPKNQSATGISSTPHSVTELEQKRNSVAKISSDSEQKNSEKEEQGFVPILINYFYIF